MKVIFSSDWHGQTPLIPDCDVLCVVGDFQRNDNIWENDDYYLRLQERMITIGVAGNHDTVLHTERRIRLNSFTHYLHDESTTINNITFFGTPYTLLERWSFHKTEEELEEIYGAIFKEMESKNSFPDVILAHQPMYGVLDRLAATNKTNPNENTGSISLRKFVEKVKPRMFVCGHIHEGYGAAMLGNTLCLNVSYNDECYRPRYQVIGWETTANKVEIINV